MAPSVAASLNLEGEIARFSGDLTLTHAARMLAEGKAAIQGGARVFDLARVGQMDSSAISLLLGLRRFAAARGHALELRSISDDLLSLATLYGVAEHL